MNSIEYCDCDQGTKNVRHKCEMRERIVLNPAKWIAAWMIAWSVVWSSAAAADWQQTASYRWRELSLPASGKTGFAKLNGDSGGIPFTNLLDDDRSITNRNLLSGSGVAAGDVDGDGLCDLYFCGLDNANVLFRNLGNWKFADVTASAGLACAGQDSTGATFADVDGSGDLDLLVNSLGGGTRLFLNDGKGRFTEGTAQAGLSSRTGSMSLALADVDGDGDLDLYVANFRPTTIKDQPQSRLSMRMINGRPVVALVDGRSATAPDLTNRFVLSPSGTVMEFGEPDAFYLNDGKGRFTPISWTGGNFMDHEGKPLLETPRDWSLAVQMRDLNGDGAPDIYVCSDLFTPDRVWMNDGKGKFRALSDQALRSTSTFSMGIDFADIDRDGNVDFFVVDMLSRQHQKRHTQSTNSKPTQWPVGLIDVRPQLLRNTLQWNRGDGTFAEIALFAGVEASDWSWGPVFLDVDLDGYEDILVTNGQLRDFQNVDLMLRMEAAKRDRQFSQADISKWLNEFPRLETPNVIFRNRGDLTFEEVGAAWGFDTPGISQGMALADLDNDGDPDVVMNNLNTMAGVYRNETVAPRLAVRLKGLAPNTQGVGAKIQVLGGPVPQSQEMICGGRYLSGDDPMRVFAAGSVTNRMTIAVTWRSGKRSSIKEAMPNRIYEIDEAGSEPHDPTTTRPLIAGGGPLFEDVSQLLGHLHTEEPFDDFERQPLMPNHLSQLGPGVCWTDLDGDGWDDLFIGSGKGGSLAIYRNNGKGGFAQIRDTEVTRVTTRDLTTILGAGGQLFVGFSNYEDGLTNGICLRVFDFKNRAAIETLDAQVSSGGPMALADIDGDGDLDLFIGGRTIPGRYPEPATSLLWRNENGKLVKSQSFEKIGLVSGAVFSDLDGDGLPELVLACEWGPVRVFRNEGGKFAEWNIPLRWASQSAPNSGLSFLNQLTGWWNGVTTGDLDGDGRMDIVATNWGLNSNYRANPKHPQRLYYGDLTGTGTLDLIEAHYDKAMGKEVPERTLRAIGAVLPLVHDRIPTFEAYGAAGLMEIFGKPFENLNQLSVTTLESMVFFNRGDHFEAVPLPNEAQFTPAFGACVGDMDGDGNEDLFLSQNFFATTPETTRNDAGRGLWLRGDGRGALKPVPGQESGVKVYGEQRGCALCDFDADGRLDLAVTQNGNETKLYRNIGAKPGLRVRLSGSPKNPSGVGAAMQLIFGQRSGPLHEVHAGSGYWSQDSAVQVLGVPEAPTQIVVRWPGGKTVKADVPTGAREIEVSVDGKIKAFR